MDPSTGATDVFTSMIFPFDLYMYKNIYKYVAKYIMREIEYIPLFPFSFIFDSNIFANSKLFVVFIEYLISQDIKTISTYVKLIILNKKCKYSVLRFYLKKNIYIIYLLNCTICKICCFNPLGNFLSCSRCFFSFSIASSYVSPCLPVTAHCHCDFL